MDVHFAKASEIDDLQSFYHLTEYGGSVSANDQVVFVTKDEKIIGAGRLSEEEGIYVLRGMRVLKEYRGRGVGNAILDSLVNKGGNYDCYCLPFSNLRSFYSTKGFNEINLSEAPDFLCRRIKNYHNRGFDVILMRKKSMD